jgi:hypothetical protein
MTSQKHYSIPGFPILTEARIGRLPNSESVGTALMELYQHSKNYWGHGQVYSYSAPGLTWSDQSEDAPSGSPIVVPDYYWDRPGDSRWPIILCSPRKDDSAHMARRLGGVFAPWRSVPYFDEALGTVTVPARITWEADYDTITGIQTLWQSGSTEPDDWYTSDRTHMGIDVQTTSTPEFHQLYNFNGPDLAFDSSMSEDLVLWYEPGNFAVLSKSTAVHRTGRTQSLQIKKSTTNLPYAIAPAVYCSGDLRNGSEYRVKVYARGDGTAAPLLKDGNGDTLVTGTSSTDWQFMDSGWFVNTGNHIRLASSSTSTDDSVYFSDLKVVERGRFGYNPHPSGQFTVGFLRTERMRVAALSVWTMPDLNLYDEEAVILPDHVRAGEPIRGYSATGRPSLGDLQYRRGYGGLAESAANNNDLERNTRRCLLQSGHPIGIRTVADAYVNLRGGENSYFKVKPRNLKNLSASTGIKAHPAFYATGEGAVRFTSIETSDTWEMGVDGEALYTDVDQEFLIAAGGDRIQIDFQAAVDSEMTLNTFSLWEGSYDDTDA